MTTRRVTSWSGRLRVVVPGTWANVPLEDPERATLYIRRLVRERVGTADRLARLRREAVQEMLVTAREAAQSGVHTYLVALELLPGVPFPAAMLIRDLPWPADAQHSVDQGDLQAALTVLAPAGEHADLRTGPSARTVEMVEGRTDETADGVDVLTMRLEYHVPYPDASRVLVVRVSVPDIPSAEPFATLFDEIVDSITFVDTLAGPAEG